MNPSGASGKVLLLVAFSFGLLAMYHFSAVLMAFLAVKIEQVPFTNLETMLERTSYRLGYKAGTVIEELLKVQSSNKNIGPILLFLFSRMVMLPAREFTGNGQLAFLVTLNPCLKGWDRRQTWLFYGQQLEQRSF